MGEGEEEEGERGSEGACELMGSLRFRSREASIDGKGSKMKEKQQVQKRERRRKKASEFVEARSKSRSKIVEGWRYASEMVKAKYARERGRVLEQWDIRSKTEEAKEKGD